MHEVLVNRLGGLSLPRKSVVRLTDRPDMTLDVNRGRKTTIQQQQQQQLTPFFNLYFRQMGKKFCHFIFPPVLMRVNSLMREFAPAGANSLIKE